jgi:hypothetical protein
MERRECGLVEDCCENRRKLTSALSSSSILAVPRPRTTMNGDATPSLSADAISELYEALEMASQSTLKSLDPMLKR